MLHNLVSTAGSAPALGEPRHRAPVPRDGRRRLAVVVVLGCLAAFLAGCTSDDDTAEPTDGTTGEPTSGVAGQPGDEPTGDLLVVDVEDLSVEEQLSFAALQGIVNRDRPTLYLVGLKSAQDFDVDPSAEVWLRDVVDLPVERVDPDEALRQLLPRTAGLVVWDPAVPYESQDVATTIAGLEDLVPVDPEMADQLTTAYEVEVVRDLRDLGLDTPTAYIEWAIENLAPDDGYPFPVWTGRPRNGRPIQPGLRDWAVMHRAFVFDADPATQQALLRRVLAMFPAGTPIYGYPFFDTEVYATSGLAVNEGVAAAVVADAGHWLVPSTDAANLSVHVHLGPSTAQPVWDDAPRTPDPDTTYVTFTISDGDAMGYDQTLLRHLQLDDLTPDSVPVGVSISPYLATDAPRIYDWIVEQSAEQVRFVAGPSGAGYAYPYAMADLDGYLDHSREMLDRHGLRATWILDPPLTPSPSTEELQAFVDRTDPSLLLTDYGGNPPEPPTVSFVDGVPVVHTVLVATSDEDIAAIVRSVAATQPPGPRFVSIGLTTWGTTVADADRAMAELGDGYEAVAPDAFAGLLRAAHEAGYEGSGEPPRVPAEPGPGECRATVIDLDATGDPFASRFLARLLAATAIESGLQVGTDEQGSVVATFDTDAIARSADEFAAAQFRLAYGQQAIDTAQISLALQDLQIEGADLGADRDLELRTDDPPGPVAITFAGPAPAGALGELRLTGTIHVTTTYDPGDGELQVEVTGPIACSPGAAAP